MKESESESARLRREIDDLCYKVAQVESFMRDPDLKAKQMISLGDEHRRLVLLKKGKEKAFAMAMNAENAQRDREVRSAVEMGHVGDADAEAKKNPRRRRQTLGSSEIARREAGKVFKKLTRSMDEKRELKRRIRASGASAEEKEAIGEEIRDKEGLIANLYSEYLDWKLEIYSKGGESENSILTSYRKGFYLFAFLLQIIGISLVSTLIARVGRDYLVEDPSQSFYVSNTGFDVLKQTDWTEARDSAGAWLSVQYSFSGIITQLRLGKEKAWIAKSTTKCKDTNTGRVCNEETTREFDFPMEYSAMPWDSCEKVAHGDFNLSTTVFDSQEGFLRNSTYVAEELPPRVYNSSYQYYIPLPPANIRECEVAWKCREAKAETKGLLVGGLIFVLVGFAIQIQRASIDSKLGMALHAICLLVGLLLVSISLTIFPDKCVAAWDEHIGDMSAGHNAVFSMADSNVEQWYPLYAECPGAAYHHDGDSNHKEQEGGYNPACDGSDRPSTVIWLWASTISVLSVLLVAVPVMTSGTNPVNEVHVRVLALQEVIKEEETAYGGSDVFLEHDRKLTRSPPSESLEMALLRVNRERVDRQRQGEVTSAVHGDSIPAPIQTL